MRKNIIIVLILAYVVSCKTRDTSGYKKDLNEFPKKFTNHFPKPERISERFITKLSHTSEYMPSKFVLTFQMEQSEFDSLKARLNSASYHKYSSNDSIPLIVNRYATPDNWIDLSYSRHEFSPQKNIDDNPPIINFYDHEEYSANSSTNLPGDFIVYVIETKKGMYWDDSHHEGDWFMPEEWKDGFSRGIALNDNSNIVIFWVVVW